MNKGSSNLSQRHQTMLKESGIAEREIAARGYETVTDRARLRGLGFGRNQLLVPGLLIPIHGVDGSIRLYQLRPDEPRVLKDKPLKYETPAGQKMALDVPPSVKENLGNPSIPLWITEGAKKADSACSHGLCCIAFLGVWNWRGTNSYGGKTVLADWESIALNKRKVYIAFDSDVTEKKEVKAALVRLAVWLESKSATVQIITIPSPDGRKVGLDDFLADGGDVAQLLAGASPIEDELVKESTSPIVRMAKLCGAYTFFHTAELKAFVSFKNGSHHETHAVDSKPFRTWLAGLYYRHFRQGLGSSVMDDLLRTLEARAMFDGPEEAVFVRIGHFEGKIYVDLADADWTIIEIDAEGWRTCPTPPISFRRFNGMLPLPMPQPGGNIETLRPQFNVASDEDLVLIAGFIIGAYKNPEEGTFPHLVFTGEQGTGKSKSAEHIARIVDPRSVKLRQLTNPEDITIGASRSKVLVFDNIGRISPTISNVLCALATGGGMTKRELFSNDEEYIIQAKTPVILTGIEDIVTASDLAQRCLFPRLAQVPESQYKTELEIENRFRSDLPKMLGWIFTAVSTALRNLPTVGSRSAPRLADFFVWVLAADEAFGAHKGLFEQAFFRSQNSATELAIEDSVLARLVLEVVSKNPGRNDYTATDLLDVLGVIASESERRELPKINKLRGALRKIAGLLRHRGVIFDESQTRSATKRSICLRQEGVSTVTTVTPGSVDQVQNDDSDGSDDTSAEWEDVEECQATA